MAKGKKVWIVCPPKFVGLMCGAYRAEVEHKRSDPEDYEILDKQERKVTLIYEDGTTETAVIVVPCSNFFELVSRVQSFRTDGKVNG